MTEWRFESFIAHIKLKIKVMKSAEEIAIQIIGESRWKKLPKVFQNLITTIARAYAAQYEGKEVVYTQRRDPADDYDRGMLGSNWREEGEGDEPVIGHFRD